MPRNHSQFTWGQAGADIGTCRECHRGKRVLDEHRLCRPCRKLCEAMTLYMDLKQAEYEQLSRIRELEGQ